jgi:hypothetical protein
MSTVSIDALKSALVAQGFDVNSEKFVMALRLAENPGGCEHCGARTKVAFEVRKVLRLACCGRKVG